MADFKTSAERQAHWDSIYEQQEIQAMNWTQEVAQPSLDLIEKAELTKENRILDVGAGASVLIKNLLDKGFQNLLATDISARALEKNKARLGEQANQVQWVVDDVTNPQQLHELDHVTLWHDRGVFHYITNFRERLNYFSLMNRVVKEEGYVILSAYNQDAQSVEAGLDVRRYNEEMMRSFMGPGYYVVDSFDVTQQTANGEREPMVYALFKRVPYIEMG